MISTRFVKQHSSAHCASMDNRIVQRTEMLYMKPQLVTTSTEGKRCHGKFTLANFGATATSKKETGSYYRKRSAQREVDRQKECGSLLKFLKVDQPEQPNQLDNEYEQSEMEKVDSSQVFDEETSDIDKTDDTIQKCQNQNPISFLRISKTLVFGCGQLKTPCDCNSLSRVSVNCKTKQAHLWKMLMNVELPDL
eukprot:Em0004g173a